MQKHVLFFCLLLPGAMSFDADNDDDRTLMMLDSAEVVSLQAMAENTVGPASVMAWNLLCFGYDLCRDYPPASEEGNNARRADPRLNARDLIRSEYYKLKVYPNPAGLYATFEWDLIHLEGDAKLRILDTYGREVARQTITTQEGQWLWDTRNVPDGIYLYELRTEAQEVLAQGKIVVKK